MGISEPVHAMATPRLENARQKVAVRLEHALCGLVVHAPEAELVGIDERKCGRARQHALLQQLLHRVRCVRELARDDVLAERDAHEHLDELEAQEGGVVVAGGGLRRRARRRLLEVCRL